MKIAKNKRIVGLERAQLAAMVKSRYTASESVRGIAEEIGRSYGFVHRLLEEGRSDRHADDAEGSAIIAARASERSRPPW